MKNLKLFSFFLLLKLALLAQNNDVHTVLFVQSNYLIGNDTIINYVPYYNNSIIQINNDLKKNVEFKNGLSPIKCNGKYGFMNEEFKISISCKYNYVNHFFNGLSLVKKDEELVLINKNDSILKKFDFTHFVYPQCFSKTNDWKIFLVKGNMNYMMDTNYNVYSIKDQDEVMKNFNNKKKYRKDESIKRSCNEIIKIIEVDSCEFVSKNVIGFRKNNLIGFADSTGNILIEPKFEYIIFVNQFDHYIVSLNNKMGVYKKNVQVIEPIYDEIDFCMNFYKVKKNGQYTMLDSKYNSILHNKYFDECTIDDEGMIKVIQKDSISKFQMTGYFNILGEQVTPIIFESGSDFHEGFCAVKIESKWGFIDDKGKFVIKAIYDSVTEFKNGVVFARLNGKWGLIDKNGIPLTDFKYIIINNFSEGYAVVSIDYLYGYIDQHGKEITPIIYNYCSDVENGTISIDIRGYSKTVKILELINNEY